MTDLPATPVTVVGAGPAGMSAAIAAAEAGVEVTLVDENPLPGGQYYRQKPPAFQVQSGRNGHSATAEGEALIRSLDHPRIHYLRNMLCWGVFDGNRLALADAERSYTLVIDRAVLATGAYDRPVAFPGWTLPGILGAGAALRLINTQYVLPGRRVVLAGLGPLQLSLAARLVEAGAQVVTVAEASNPYRRWRHALGLWGHWRQISDAWRYMSVLRRHRVPVQYDWAIVEAKGTDRVEGATLARLDAEGRPIGGTEREFQVDSVCLGYGLISSFQLPVAFGCELRFDSRSQWHLPRHGADMQTSRPGIFVAGDVTSMGGAYVAAAQGRVAGLAAARQILGMRPDLDKRLAASLAHLRYMKRLADALQTLYAWRPGLSNLITDDTTICRCEEVSCARVRQEVAGGATDLHQVKLVSRAGMGYCQSRFCAVLIGPLVAQATGQPLGAMRPFSIRPPIHPLPLHVLAAGLQADREA